MNPFEGQIKLKFEAPVPNTIILNIIIQVPCKRAVPKKEGRKGKKEGMNE
jgi:hypothetical protein